jgi:hypothetical protein
VIPATKLRALEAFDSALVADLPPGTQFEVVEVGTTPNRIRVTAGRQGAGWISKASDQGKPIVKWVRKRRTSLSKEGTWERRASDENDNLQTQDGLRVGDQCETVIAMTLREGEDFKSTAVGQIPENTQFEILKVAPSNRVKVHVSSTVLEGGAVGWISSKTDTGGPLIKKTARRRKSGLNIAGNLSIPLGQVQRPGLEAAPPGLKRTMSPAPDAQKPSAAPAAETQQASATTKAKPAPGLLSCMACCGK